MRACVLPASLTVITAALVSTMMSPTAESLEPIKYILRFPAPHTHYVEVEAVYPTGRRPEIDLKMAVWTPGSYLVREYARHVEDLVATGSAGTTLSVRKTRKNRWRVATGGAPAVTVRYRVYSREMSVRTNWVEAQFAMLNGAPTFITLHEGSARPHDVTLVLPSAWTTSATALDPAPGGTPHHYLAPDFDTIVDSPIVAGNPAVYEFEVAGRRHALVNEGEAGVWDGPRSARDVEAIVRATERLWRVIPYERYVFLNMITEAGGGLEHRNSTLLMTNRWRTSTRADYLGWLGLVSHELFHAWNVKRLRPVELGPFDYENEVYTENLWVSEGFTDYYGDLLVRRADLSADDEYLRELSNLVRGLQTTPGRAVQSASQASYDAWIRQYRPDENSPNVSISYYTKGAVVAFLLDARIRQATGGARSLDDLMRLAFSRFSGARGFTTAEFRKAAGEVAGVDLGPWFAHAVDGTGELDYGEAFAWLGLRFKPESEDGRERKAWLGLTTRNDAGRLVVTQVRRGTPGYDAGFNVDDEIVAIDEFRVRGDQWGGRLEKYRPGQQVSVLVARRDRLLRLDATLGVEPGDPWRIEIDPLATADQVDRRRRWLAGE
jgi:predicted metalloprotease with PDZ domain